MALAAVFHTVHITMLTHLFWDHKGQQCKCCLKFSGSLYNNIVHCKNEKILFLGFSDWHTGRTSRTTQRSLKYSTVHSKNFGVYIWSAFKLAFLLWFVVTGWSVWQSSCRNLSFHLVHSHQNGVFFFFTHMILVNKIYFYYHFISDRWFTRVYMNFFWYNDQLLLNMRKNHSNQFTNDFCNVFYFILNIHEKKQMEQHDLQYIIFYIRWSTECAASLH